MAKTSMTAKVDVPGYTAMQRAFVSYHKDTGLPVDMLQALFHEGFYRAIQEHNRVTRSELESAVQSVKGNPDRTVEDLLSALGFEVSDV